MSITRSLISSSDLFRPLEYTPRINPSMSSPPVPETSCATCNHVDIEDIPPPPILKRQAADDNLEDADAADADAVTFHEAFAAMTIKLPPSERVKTLARFEKGGINPLEDSPEGEAIVEKAFGQYAKRLERSRAGSPRCPSLSPSPSSPQSRRQSLPKTQPERPLRQRLPWPVPWPLRRPHVQPLF